MSVCGILASLPALHLSACVCACMSGAVCAHAQCVFNAIRHHVICWGREPCGSWTLTCCAKSVGAGDAGGCESWHDPPRDAGALLRQ